EIDSIRLFDPETQLSERKLSEVKIIPNVETQFGTGEKVSLLNFLPENTIVWTMNWDFIKERIEQELEDVEEVVKLEEIDRNQETLSGKKLPLSSRQTDEEELNEKRELSIKDFVRPGVLEEQLKERNIVEIGSRPFFSASQKIDFNVIQQPAFNRQ